jgi:transglutaminase-like putative cysteine protease
MRVAIRHYTQYHYDRSVFLSSHLLKLKPAAHCRTPIESYSLIVKPENHFIHWQQDPFGNFMARIDFQQPTQQLSIEVELVANIAEVNPFDFFLDEYAQSFPFAYDAQLEKDLSPYLEISTPGPNLKQWLRKVDRSTKATVDFLVMLNQMLYQDIGYTIRMQPGVQTDEETLEQALGSCRDTTWLLVQILRQLGLAARFVSGYLVQLTSPTHMQQDGPKEDFTALHAWAEVYIPEQAG